ncbi:hypothetical protein ACSBR1_040989 [Camellia fascicularis]
MGSCISQPNPLNNHHHEATTATTTTTNNTDDYHQVGDPDLTNMIGEDLNFMKETMIEIQKFIDHMNVQINQASQKFKDLKTRGGGGETGTEEFGELKKAVKKLKSQIPSKLIKTHYDDHSKPRRNPWVEGSINSASSSNYQIYANEAAHLNILYYEPKFYDITAALKDIWKLQCLTFFLMFPAMVIIMLCLVGRFEEGFRKGKEKGFCRKFLGPFTESFGYEFLKEFTERGFIEPIYKNSGLVIDSYRMSYSIHSALLQIRMDLDRPVCTMDSHTVVTEICFLNFGEAIVDSRFEWFFNHNHFRVVYLGRWQNSVTHHIEVADIKILNALKNMKQLRFLSLRGISLIKELPQFISQLTNLEIIHLKACHNLEVIPNWIGLLKGLTHLDISECYLLDHMPKGLGALFKLQVLKGFIIGDSKDKNSCTINDLTMMILCSLDRTG